MILVRSQTSVFLCLQGTEIIMKEFSNVSVLEHPNHTIRSF